MEFSNHFTWKKLFKFSLPPIMMMIFTSLYGIVDGFFISNYVGDSEFASINIIMPLITILGSIGFMVGSGGSALISKTIGEKKLKKANEIFSLLIYFSFIIGVIVSIITIIFIKPICILLGAEDKMIDMAATYGRIILYVMPLYILQFAFQSLIITSGKPTLGLIVTLISGFTNIILDALFIIVFKLGLAGASLATAIGQSIGGLIPLIYFANKNNTSLLKLGKTKIDLKALLQTLFNGSSEFISNVAMSIVSIAFNLQLMKYYGQDGVSAYGIYMYVGLIFVAIFIGYTSAISPIVGYNYGAKNTNELKSIFKKSILLISITSVSMFLVGLLLSKPLAFIFVSYNDVLMDLTIHVITIASFSFLFCGINIFTSGFFTALNNGLISAICSFIRTLVFQLVLVIIFPLIFKSEGIWYSIVVAEIFSVILSCIFLVTQKKKYQY